MEGAGQTRAARALEVFKRHRILILVYTIGILFGVREYVVTRDKPAFEWLTLEGQVLAEMLAELNPEDPETQYLQAMNVLAEGDRVEFERRMEVVLASDMKHNQEMLRFYAEYLIATGADREEINAALNRWIENFPFTKESITLRLGTGPTTAPQAEAFERLVADIPWVADRRLGRIVEGNEGRWVLQLLFRRGHPIDIRDVSDALDRAIRL
jgi:hypothetical protein